MIITSQQSIADLFGVSRETIDAWQKNGMPVDFHGGPGKPSRFDSAKCISWRIESEVGKAVGERPQNWLAREQAIAKQMDNLERRGMLIPADQLEPKLRATMIAAREFWRNEPTRLAREGAGKSTREVEDLLAIAFDQFLVKLSRWPASQAAAEQQLDDDQA